MKRYLFLAVALFMITSCFVFAQSVRMPVPNGKVELFDGFEHGNYWIWAGSDYDQWGSHKYSCGADISKKWASEGKHSLACRMEASPNQNGWYDGQWLFDGSQDLSGTKYVVLDVYNPNEFGVQVGMVFQTTDSWNWRDASNVWIEKGEHTLVYDVSSFENEMSQVKRVNITIGTYLPIPRESTIYIDNIRLVK